MVEGPDRAKSRMAVWALNTDGMGHLPDVTVVRVPGSTSAYLAAQAGLFTVLRQKVTPSHQPVECAIPLDEYIANHHPPHLPKVTVPASEAPEVLKLCEMYHVTGATIFPDYNGAARAAVDRLESSRWKRYVENASPSAARSLS